MFYKFKKGKQRELLQRAIKKAGSERKLAKSTKLPKGSISSIKLEKRVLSEKHALEICNFLNISLNEMNYKEKLPHNWAQIKGGNILIMRKKENGTFQETVERLRKVTHKRLVEWHKYMRENEPKKYYTWQYERFKKVGRGYQYSLTNGTKVRNELEKEVGDYLIKHFNGVEYEPYINIKDKAYFPDFKYKNVLVEVTEWKHPSEKRIKNLKRKCNDYEAQNYVLCFYIPRIFRKFYKFLKSPVITTLPKLKEFINASIA